jgi:hypothetical protein
MAGVQFGQLFCSLPLGLGHRFATMGVGIVFAQNATRLENTLGALEH